MNKILLTLITLYIFTLLFIYDFGGIKHKLHPAQVKTELKDFLETHKKNKLISNKNFLILKESIHLEGNGYTIKKLNENEILATPITRVVYIEENLFKRIIFLNFKKFQNPDFKIDFKKDEIKLIR